MKINKNTTMVTTVNMSGSNVPGKARHKMVEVIQLLVY